MKGRRLDKNNDIYLEDGMVCRNQTFRDTVKQRVKTTLQTFTGELFVDPRVGVAWYEKVLNQSILAIDLAKQEIKNVIENVDGVDSVETVSVKFIDSTLSVKYRIKLTDASIAEGEV